MFASVEYRFDYNCTLDEKISHDEFINRIRLVPKMILTEKEGSSNLTWHDTFLKTAELLGQRSHCVSKGVACVITKDSRIISTGINGTPSGLRNCDSIFKRDTFDKVLHHEFSQKYEIHAEINALLSAAKNGIALKDSTLYVNYSPCRECAKSIVAAGITKVVFRNFYENDLNGLVFLILCDKVSVEQIVEGPDEESIKKAVGEKLQKLDNIGKCFDSIHPFPIPLWSMMEEYQESDFKPC